MAIAGMESRWPGVMLLGGLRWPVQASLSGVEAARPAIFYWRRCISAVFAKLLCQVVTFMQKPYTAQNEDAQSSQDTPGFPYYNASGYLWVLRTSARHVGKALPSLLPFLRSAEMSPCDKYPAMESASADTGMLPSLCDAVVVPHR